MFGLGAAFFGGGGSTFSATYRVYPVSFLEKESAERGDKLILPPSALDRLGAFSPHEKDDCEIFFFVFFQSPRLFPPRSSISVHARDRSER